MGGVFMKSDDTKVFRLISNSIQVTILLVALLVMNYVASYSHTIEAFIQKATQ